MSTDSSAPVPYFTSEQLFDLISMRDAVDGLEQAVIDGLEPGDALARNSVPLQNGSFLLMPSEHGEFAGVKVASVAPGNPTHGLPKIQGTFLLFDSSTFAPVAIMDGASLTSIRTPALSALGIRHLAADEASTALVFGTGPQAFNHVVAAAAVRDIDEVIVVGRDDKKGQRLVDDLTAVGHSARAGTAENVAEADIIMCCTSAREPIFDGSLVRDHALVVAMGSHEAEAREIPEGLMSRSTVYVEDVDTALREAGDVVIAINKGAMSAEDLHELAPLVRNGAVTGDGPTVFKTVGMGWEDLVTAQVAFRKANPSSRG